MDEMDEMGWYDEAVMVLWVMYAKMYAMMMGMSMNWGLRLPSLYTLQSMNIDMATNIGKKQLDRIFIIIIIIMFLFPDLSKFTWGSLHVMNPWQCVLQISACR